MMNRLWIFRSYFWSIKFDYNIHSRKSKNLAYIYDGSDKWKKKTRKKLRVEWNGARKKHKRKMIYQFHLKRASRRSFANDTKLLFLGVFVQPFLAAIQFERAKFSSIRLSESERSGACDRAKCSKCMFVSTINYTFCLLQCMNKKERETLYGFCAFIQPEDTFFFAAM